MIIYNKKWLANSMLVDLVEKEHEQGSLSDTELNNIKKHYPIGFYTPNLYIRVGLFIVTVTISGGVERLLSLLFLDSGFKSGYFLAFLTGVLNFIALLFIVKKKFHFRSGVDDALLWLSFIWIVIAFNWGLGTVQLYEERALSLFIFLLSRLLSLSFTDRVMALVSYLSLFAFVYFSWQKIGEFGISTLPFVLMLVSALIYWIVFRIKNQRNTTFYKKSIIVLQAISLITLYVSGNFYVVKELGDLLNKSNNGTIAFGWFFWVWTIIIPIAYIYRGLLIKDAISLRVGLLLCIPAFLTLRHYHHSIPLEWVLILIGAITLAVSWFLTSYLKTPKHGLTYKDLSSNSLMDQLKIESLIISETSSSIGNAPTTTGTQMGGGKFGGGGASDGF